MKHMVKESLKSTLRHITAANVLEEAYPWLCQQRKDYSHNISVWYLRIHWHRIKTFLGCIKKGFDFLGVHFGDAPEISKTSLENHRSKIALRNAQGANKSCIGDYKARWSSWSTRFLKRCYLQEEIVNPMPVIHCRSLVNDKTIKEIQHENILGGIL